MANRKRSAARSPKWTRATRANSRGASVTEHHRAGLELVTAALQRELARVGERHTRQDGSRFSWRDIVPVPATVGAQAQREFTGRTAAVIDAAARVEHTYELLRGPAMELLKRLRRVRDAIDDAWNYASESGLQITAQIHNADITRRSNIAFGAEPRDIPSFDIDRANRALLRCSDQLEDLDATIGELEARKPDVVTAGFYEVGATGPVGHFAMLLRRTGLAPEEIADVLGRAPDRSASAYEDTWKRRTQAANDNAKHLANRAERKLSQRHRSGTAERSTRVPPRPLRCVIVRLNAGEDQDVAAYVAELDDQSSDAPSGASEPSTSKPRRGGRTGARSA